MNCIMAASEAAKICKGELYGSDADICRRWRADSRDITFGDAFVAVKGGNTDGHLFVRQAIDRGAQMLLVQKNKVSELGLDSPDYAGLSTIAVDDTLKALSALAHAYFEKVSPQIVGITGSVGKTTTRELLVAALGKKYKLHSAIRSFNTSLGCSLVVLEMPADTEMLVLEFGTNHFGEISEMTDLFPPETALITEIAPAHLAGFGSIGGVLKAKLEICSRGVRVLVYNADNVLLKESLQAGVNAEKLIGVGYSGDADLKIMQTKIFLDNSGAKISAVYRSEDVDFECSAGLFGKQHAYNVGYALAAARYYGVSDEDIKSAFAELNPIAGRGVCKKLPNNSWVIDEAYNANPASMRAAIENLYEISGSMKKTAVLAGMRELGKDILYWHKEILFLAKRCDRLFLLGEEWHAVPLPENAKLYDSFEDLTENVINEDLSDTVLLIKGSNSYGLKRLVTVLTEG